VQFDRAKVASQTEQMVNYLVRNNLIEIDKTERVGLEKRLARIVLRYITEYEQLDDDTYRFLAEHDLLPDDYYKRVLNNLAKEAELPLGSDALDELNKDIEAFLWDDDAIIELFADSRELVAAVTPYLKAMKR
jgi:hypothetical protein